MEKAKRGNDVCRVCQMNLKVTYVNCAAKYCVNIFKVKLYGQCIIITIEFMFVGINMFWARLDSF